MSEIILLNIIINIAFAFISNLFLQNIIDNIVWNILVFTTIMNIYYIGVCTNIYNKIINKTYFLNYQYNYIYVIECIIVVTLFCWYNKIDNNFKSTYPNQSYLALYRMIYGLILVVQLSIAYLIPKQFCYGSDIIINNTDPMSYASDGLQNDLITKNSRKVQFNLS